MLRVFFDQLSEQEILRHLLITDQVLLLYLFLIKYSFCQFSNFFILIKSQMIISTLLIFGTNQEHGRRTVLHEVVTNRDKISTHFFFFPKIIESQSQCVTTRWFDANHLDKVGTRTLITTHHYRWTWLSASSLFLTFKYNGRFEANHHHFKIRDLF